MVEKQWSPVELLVPKLTVEVRLLGKAEVTIPLSGYVDLVWEQAFKAAWLKSSYAASDPPKQEISGSQISFEVEGTDDIRQAALMQRMEQLRAWIAEANQGYVAHLEEIRRLQAVGAAQDQEDQRRATELQEFGQNL